VDPLRENSGIEGFWNSGIEELRDSGIEEYWNRGILELKAWGFGSREIQKI
jgi:hypothetical protein